MEGLSISVTPKTSYTPALWAVDPSEQYLRPSVEALTEIKHFLGNGFLHVHPVYVCAEESTPLEQAQTQVREYLKPLDLGTTANVEIVYAPTNSRSDWVKRILRVADKQNVQVILLTSHGRSTLGAFFLGSFAYELLQKSTLPVLFLNPQRKKAVGNEKVLFATDFSAGSKAAFYEFLKLVKGKVSDFILFHAINFPMLSLNEAQAAGVVASIPESFFNDQRAWAQSQIDSWMKEAQQIGIQIRFQPLIEESLTSAAEAIETVAERENVGLIGLVSHVGPIARLAVGSVTQDLLSAQKFNLWVCGPNMRLEP